MVRRLRGTLQAVYSVGAARVFPYIRRPGRRRKDLFRVRTERNRERTSADRLWRVEERAAGNSLPARGQARGRRRLDRQGAVWNRMRAWRRKLERHERPVRVLRRLFADRLRILQAEGALKWNREQMKKKLVVFLQARPVRCIHRPYWN